MRRGNVGSGGRKRKKSETDRQTERSRERRTDTQTERSRERQPDTHTHTHTHRLAHTDPHEGGEITAGQRKTSKQRACTHLVEKGIKLRHVLWSAV